MRGCAQKNPPNTPLIGPPPSQPLRRRASPPPKSCSASRPGARPLLLLPAGRSRPSSRSAAPGRRSRKVPQRALALGEKEALPVNVLVHSFRHMSLETSHSYTVLLRTNPQTRSQRHETRNPSTGFMPSHTGGQVEKGAGHLPCADLEGYLFWGPYFKGILLFGGLI